MNLKLRTFFFLLLIIISQLRTPNSALYAQNAQVTVPADVTTQTIILNPQGQAPSAPVEGEIYYHDDPNNQPYYYDGNNW